MDEVVLLHNGIEEFHILINKTYGCAVDRKEAGKKEHLHFPLLARVRACALTLG
jgi:hypothetical protein